MTYSATLVGDGSSDSLLKPILEWLLSQHLPADVAIAIKVPEWGSLPGNESLQTLPKKLLAARTFFTADLYFIHRDAEKDSSWAERYQEIEQAVAKVFKDQSPPFVHIVPVQMTETWLLHNEAAIREAAANKNGRVAITLPSPTRLETQKEAKTLLLSLLRQASELTGRRLRQFEANERHRLYRLADLQQETGFAVLRVLPAFRALEAEIATLAATLKS